MQHTSAVINVLVKCSHDIGLSWFCLRHYKRVEESDSFDGVLILIQPFIYVWFLNECWKGNNKIGPPGVNGVFRDSQKR